MLKDEGRLATHQPTQHPTSEVLQVLWCTITLSWKYEWFNFQCKTAYHSSTLSVLIYWWDTVVVFISNAIVFSSGFVQKSECLARPWWVPKMGYSNIDYLCSSFWTILADSCVYCIQLGAPDCRDQFQGFWSWGTWDCKKSLEKLFCIGTGIFWGIVLLAYEIFCVYQWQDLHSFCELRLPDYCILKWIVLITLPTNYGILFCLFRLMLLYFLLMLLNQPVL